MSVGWPARSRVAGGSGGRPRAALDLEARLLVEVARGEHRCSRMSVAHLLNQLREPRRQIGRALTNTFAGIAPEGVPAFIVFQVLGALLAIALRCYWNPSIDATDLIVAHAPPGPPSPSSQEEVG